jgi:hypothetical protein
MQGMSDDSEAMHGVDLLGMALGRGMPGAAGADLDEFVDFEIYFDGALQAAKVGEVVPLLRARLCDSFEVFGKSGLERYMWHCDRLLLEIDLGDSLDDEPHLAGHLRTGDGAEDEWFLTFLLQSLTAARPDTSCRIVDADGELLIIEAALAAPRWLSPSNAENRCWLRKGQVHILPKPKPPEPEHVSCKEALERLRRAGAQMVAKDKVQHAISSRLEGYPKRALELSTHVARAVVPATVARLLIAYPQLTSVALDNLPLPATQELSRLRKALSGVEASIRFDCESLSENDMICIGVRLTRCQYARLMGLRCQLPQRFTQRNWQPPKGQTDDKSRRVGAMLCAGLDAAFLQASQSATLALRWPNSKLNGSLFPETLPWLQDPQFSKHTAELRENFDCESLLVKRAFEQQRDLDEEFRPALIAAMRKDAVKSIDISRYWRDEDDSEEWLQVSAEEIDQEMQRRQEEFDSYDRKRAASHGGEAAGRAEAAASAMPEKLREELASMGKEISGMLQRTSHLDGVEASLGASNSAKEKEISDSDSEGSDEIDVLGMEEEPDMPSGSDEEEEEVGMTAEEMHKYMAALDEQLEEHEGFEEQANPEAGKHAGYGGEAAEQGLPLGSHHIRVDATEPLDLDLHAMEHMLASYCAEHHFEPGPASLLLGELGLAGSGKDAGAGASLDSMD